MNYDQEMDDIQVVLDGWTVPFEQLEGGDHNSPKRARTRQAVEVHAKMHQIHQNADNLTAEQEQRLVDQAKRLLTHGFGFPVPSKIS